MSPVVLIGTAAAIGVMPVISLGVLTVMGAVTVVPALVAMAVCVLAAFGLAALWAHDLQRLAETVKFAGEENTAALARAAAAPSLPPVSSVARGIERLSRALSARAVQVGGLLHANEAIVEILPDPLLVLGADGALQRANAAARAAFGGDMAAVLRHPGLRTAIERAYAQRTTQSVELSLPVPVQREVWASVIYLDPSVAGGGRAIVVLSDRTRDRMVERMRADFVANASHELRTPLASLMGFIETLRGPAADDPPAQARFLGIMAEQSERMNRLIDDLLSLSRIELTEHRAPADQVALDELVESVVAGFEPRLAARRVTIDLDIAADLPNVTADADQLAQVMTNLVDNAVKYGREGGVVRVSVRNAPPDTRWPARAGVLLAVGDDGPGIPRAHVPRLTERFYRVDKGRSRNAGGTGLGLAIVKHIVNRHRGQLVIESEEGRGTTFTVWLPRGAEK